MILFSIINTPIPISPSKLQLQIKKLKDFCERVRARVEIGENGMS
jgi:hypothetical protein